MSKHRIWSLAKVTKKCRSAPAVWLALNEKAAEKGSRMVTPSRKQLAKMSGIERVKTISQALGVLENAGWINRSHVPVYEAGRRCGTYLVITILLTGQHAPHKCATHLRGGSRPSIKGRKTPHPPTEGGGPNGPALSLPVGSGPGRHIPYVEPQPISVRQSMEKKTHNVGSTA